MPIVWSCGRAERKKTKTTNTHVPEHRLKCLNLHTERYCYNLLALVKTAPDRADTMARQTREGDINANENDAD